MGNHGEKISYLDFGNNYKQINQTETKKKNLIKKEAFHK